MSEEDSQSSENVLEKIKKKYKKDQPNISIDENIDVRDVAIQKYKEMKNEYKFVSFEEANKKKKVASGEYEQYNMPMFDFNENLYQYRRDGFCSNPNSETKGLIFSNKNPQFQELEGD